MECFVPKTSERTGVKDGQRINLSAKMERLKRGLRMDTVAIPRRQFPTLKESQLSYAQKSGHFGAFDPLRKRTKLFRQSVLKYAPPYYFWHKEYVNRRKLKPVAPVDLRVDLADEVPDARGDICCIWCRQTIPYIHYEMHRTKRCKRRLEHLGVGYYRCESCREGFIDEGKAKDHISLHFPSLSLEGDKLPVPTKHTIICRDHSKRKKWL